jgi:glycosyltransferase involved in cell wall biosynthesis
VTASEPIVSVVIPARNATRYLREALSSVLEPEAGLALEAIVVDDGSTDATAALAAELGARVVSQEALGIGSARNLGVAAARGAFIGFLDADDLWAPGSLAARLEALRGEPAADLVWGRVRHFLSPDVAADVAARLFCPPGSMIAHLAGGMLARRSLFDRVGPFSASVRAGEFVDWLLRARECGVRELAIEDVVLLRRVHGENHTVRNRTALNDLTHILKDSLDRRRALGSGSR